MRRRLARSLALAGYFGLLTLVTAWHAWLAPSARLPVSLVLLLTAVPLLVPLRGLLYGRPRSHVWAALLSLPYFVHGVGETFAAGQWLSLGALETILSLTLFFAATLYARWAVTTT